MGEKRCTECKRNDLLGGLSIDILFKVRKRNVYQLRWRVGRCLGKRHLQWNGGRHCIGINGRKCNPDVCNSRMVIRSLLSVILLRSLRARCACNRESLSPRLSMTLDCRNVGTGFTDLQHHMLRRVDRNRMRFTVGTKVEVSTSGMHTLVANAMYDIATSVTESGMDRFRKRRDLQVVRIMQESKAVIGVMNGYDRVT
jgi:hypothetical protein